MEIAISLPDETVSRAIERAAELGISFSEFFARAATRYLTELDDQATTRQIDRALERAELIDDTSAQAVEVGRNRLTDTADEW